MNNKNLIGRGIVTAVLIPAMLSGCATYHLKDHKPGFVVNKQVKATKDVCAVAPFSFEPTDKSDAKMMNKADLEEWDDLFFQAVNRADVCGRAVKVSSMNSIPTNARYIIDGKVTEFSFERNWVPMFFPVWMGMTVITLGIYGLAAGPMTTTQADFAFTVNLKDAKTHQAIESITEQFEKTDVQTLYSDNAGNAYKNPGLAFEPTLNEAMRKLSSAITRLSSKNVAVSAKDRALKDLQDLREKGELSHEEYYEQVKDTLN